MPIGAASLCIGFIAYFIKFTQAFETIELSGEISPQFVAGVMGEAPVYSILGLLILAITYIFKFVNQE